MNNRIRDLREDHDLTQQQIARRDRHYPAKIQLSGNGKAAAY